MSKKNERELTRECSPWPKCLGKFFISFRGGPRNRGRIGEYVAGERKSAAQLSKICQSGQFWRVVWHITIEWKQRSIVWRARERGRILFRVRTRRGTGGGEGGGGNWSRGDNFGREISRSARSSRIKARGDKWRRRSHTTRMRPR